MQPYSTSKQLQCAATVTLFIVPRAKNVEQPF